MVNVNVDKLVFFKKSHQLTLEIYKLTKESYPKEEMYSLISQIRRASSSICANIKEGSIKTLADFKRFLLIAVGSAKEVEYWLLLSKDLNYISTFTYDRLQKDLNQIIGSLINYINSLEVEK